MKQIFRNPVVYAVELSSLADRTADQVVEALAGKLPAFVPIGEHQSVSSGFEPVVLDEIFTGLLKLFATAPAEEPAEDEDLF